MGPYITKLVSVFSPQPLQVKIFMGGLDNAGKTTILYKMKLNQVLETTPTIGLNVQSVNYKNINFIIWDFGYGSTHNRMLWKHYYPNSDALIYVLDSSDKERLDLACEAFQEIIKHLQFNIPILILANKLDISTISINQIIELFALNKLKQKWHIEPCCALDGKGVIQGFGWLQKIMVKKINI